MIDGVNYEEAVRWLDRVDPVVARPDRSITARLDRLKELSKDGGLTRDAAAAWYALVGEMRRLADYYERGLIRRLRAHGLPWAQVADAVHAHVSSRPGAQAQWKRLLVPGRRTTTGNMRRGGRRKQTSTAPRP